MADETYKPLLAQAAVPRRPPVKLRFPAYIGVSVFIAVLVLLWVTLQLLVLLAPRSVPRLNVTSGVSAGLGTWPHESEKSFRRDPREYVLDLKWDTNAEPTLRYYHWTITDVQGNPDGVTRTMVLINGQFPGPLVECNQGDTVVLEVLNKGTNATAIHFHGMLQNGTNWMDGTVGITSCPIAPGGSFTYRFVVQNPGGTYWYHSHFSTQRSDGVFGPVVIHSKNEATQLEYASDHIVMLHDYYYDLSAALLPQYLASDNENEEPVPDNALINGLNIRDCSIVEDRYQCDNSSANYARFDLDSSKAHRMRFINVGSFAEFDVAIDGTKFSVTEVDGVDVHPEEVHRFLINVAQRYSIVLPPREAAVGGQVWLRARMITHCFASTPRSLNPEVRGVIRYFRPEDAGSVPSGDAALALPTTKGWDETIALQCKDLNTSNLHPVSAQDAPKPDMLYPIRSNFEIGAYRLSRGYFNRTSWRPMTLNPTLAQAIDGLAAGDPRFAGSQNGVLDRAFDAGRQLVVSVEGRKVVDLLIDNFDDGNHPFHLHGHKFWVLAHGKGYFNMSHYDALDTRNPLRRDTATIEGFGWILIRFVADNPGIWAFHCHITWHVEAGMLMQFLVQPSVVAGWTIPSEVTELCKAPNADKGHGIDDSVFMVPLGGR